MKHKKTHLCGLLESQSMGWISREYTVFDKYLFTTLLSKIGTAGFIGPGSYGLLRALCSVNKIGHSREIRSFLYVRDAVSTQPETSVLVSPFDWSVETYLLLYKPPRNG